MNRHGIKDKQVPIKALDKKTEAGDVSEDLKEQGRDWHSMSEEERLEILSHLSDIPFQ
ncbi:MAG: hypothetical protein ACPG5L_08325 [Vibrio gallaecicus]|uniref:hypothetical protein n=1 Tax=Vibrio TaxID=662 RepID=UPI0015D0FCFD|nr:hypothetical protein [Vibrio gallaecicus]MDN3613086.1 hypothetical protein [Vibrio gallaecicus]